MQVLLDRLSALRMMLEQKPVVSGRYTTAPYVSNIISTRAWVLAVRSQMRCLAHRMCSLLAVHLLPMHFDCCASTVSASTARQSSDHCDVAKPDHLDTRHSHAVTLQLHPSSLQVCIKLRSKWLHVVLPLLYCMLLSCS